MSKSSWQYIQQYHTYSVKLTLREAAQQISTLHIKISTLHTYIVTPTTPLLPPATKS